MSSLVYACVTYAHIHWWWSSRPLHAPTKDMINHLICQAILPLPTSPPCNAIDHNPQVAAEAHHTQQAQHSHQPDHAKKPKLGKLNCKA